MGACEDEYMNNVIHDCHYDVIGVVPSDEKIKEIADKLSDDIKHLANRWGWYDTEVRGEVYEWIEKNCSK